MKIPEVSVVMSVYNGAETLPETLQSVLDQQGCDFEFIVVNDGSTDASPRVLDEWALRDVRLRVIHQANTGLTRALMRGCAEARGEFIARQDCGDVSLPGRLVRQLECLQRGRDVIAASCFTQFTGPQDEPLYCTEISEKSLNVGLGAGVDGRFQGPSHHGSMMMRRDAYQAVGGYRAGFYFAQDLDLWTRLAEKGRFSVVHEVLYAARLEPHSISGTQTHEQGQLAKLIWAAAQARRAGESESAFLTAAAAIRPVAHLDLARRVARGNYFIGSCLIRKNPKASVAYFRQATRHDPSHWRAWLRLIQSTVRSLV